MFIGIAAVGETVMMLADFSRVICERTLCSKFTVRLLNAAAMTEDTKNAKCFLLQFSLIDKIFFIIYTQIKRKRKEESSC